PRGAAFAAAWLAWNGSVSMSNRSTTRPSPRFNPNADEAGMIINDRDSILVLAGTPLLIEEAEGRRLIEALGGELLPPDRNYFGGDHIVDALHETRPAKS